MKRFLSVTTLALSTTTLFCCFLPALFVFLGLGATFASLVSSFPGLIALSQHKGWVFGGAATLIGVSAIYRALTPARCPVEARERCQQAKDWSRVVHRVSLVLFALGAFFAFIAPRLV